MKAMVVGAVLSAALLCAGANVAEVQARAPAEVLARAQLSLLVKGRIDVEPDGRVSAIRVDDEAEYSEAVMRIVRDTVRGWEFEPIIQQGQAVAFTTPMSLRLVAKPAGSEGYSIRIASQAFNNHDIDDRTTVRASEMKPPRYPEAALRAGVTGNVYLAVLVGRDGNVLDVAARQVDLTSAGREREMQRARDILMAASVQAARKWQFMTPEIGAAAGQDSWVLTIPVSFSLDDPHANKTRWQLYIPGPTLQLPFPDPELGDFSTALAGGEVYLSERSQQVRLKSPAGG